jgi:hypothetical protein
MTQKEAIAKAPRGRPNRAPLGRKRILTVQGLDEAYAYRFVNDTGDRVQSFLDNGWETIPADQVRIGDKRVNQSAPEGTVAQANVGQGQKGFLLRIKREWYDEDQEAKQVEVNRTENAMREEALNGTYGKLEISRN